MILGRRLPATALATVVVGVLGLSACGTSTPSNRRMAQDIIETVDGLTDAERACMQEKLDGYSGDELDAINEENQNVDWDAEGATGGPKWQAFVEDLDSCRDGAAASSEPAGTDVDSSEADTDDSAVEPADSSEPAETTDPAATTEPGRR